MFEPAAGGLIVDSHRGIATRLVAGYPERAVYRMETPLVDHI
jgi:hypothetical protein